MTDQKFEPSLTKHQTHPSENELAWRDEQGRPHVANLAQERAAQAEKANGSFQS